MISKLEVNTDYFLTEKAYKAYMFNCTKGDTKDYLILWYNPNSPELFTIAKEMIDYLETYYSNHFKVQNTYTDYYRLNMKSIETFIVFYTCFSYLTGYTQIPIDN
jgi:hypothetical protein